MIGIDNRCSVCMSHITSDVVGPLHKSDRITKDSSIAILQDLEDTNKLSEVNGNENRLVLSMGTVQMGYKYVIKADDEYDEKFPTNKS